MGIQSGRFGSDLTVTTSTGADTLQLTDSRVTGTAWVGMGGGDDAVSLGASGQRNVFVGDFTATGSGGADDYDQMNNVFRGTRTVTRFRENPVDTAPVLAAVEGATQMHGHVLDILLYRVRPLNATPDHSAESVGTWVTKRDLVAATGKTTNDALVEVDSDGDGQFDDIIVRADEFGAFDLTLPLVAGPQTFAVRSTDYRGTAQLLDLKIHRSLGSVARFKTSLGPFDVELLDADAPLTVANYKAYFDDYTNAVIHRSVSSFVVQGGGFEWVNGQLQAIETNPPVQNEFNPDNSNVRGTLSTALLSNRPDSATNQWFINLKDNSFLDAAKHTVFGRVIGDGMDIVDQINALDIFNLDGGVFAETPLRDYEIFSRELTGTMTASSFTITGTGTLFTEELSVGSRLRLKDGDQVIGDYTVTRIDSDTELQVSQAVSSATDVKGFTHEKIDETNFVFADIDEILKTI